MLDLLLSVCVMTHLNCNDIHFHVYYNDLPMDVYAMAGIDHEGEYHIFVDRDVKRKGKSFKKEIAVHELAHLMVYDVDPTDTSHGERFTAICEDLAKTVGLNVRASDVCETHAGPVPFWAARMRRR